MWIVYYCLVLFVLFWGVFKQIIMWFLENADTTFKIHTLMVTNVT